ncbi:MAG TPA: isoprenylcysteine carboxylmethyltransferase family protein [Candidatus Nanoarchaeia archaeon]|nr:isoprenylcysteine carboxylmethyltransferase family protein [Candidatus Nanoarchaeia archaeon]
MDISILPFENFPNPVTATVFSVLVIIVILVELRIMTRMHTDLAKDKMSFFVVLAPGIILPLFITYILATLGIGRLPTWMSYIGIAVVVLGFILRQYAIHTLGKFFVPVVTVRKEQRIIQKGPYRYVRHPSYTGLLLELVGAGLAVSNWVAAVLSLVLATVALSYRISVEERALRQHFGKKYKEYQAKTKRLIPGFY